MKRIEQQHKIYGILCALEIRKDLQSNKKDAGPAKRLFKWPEPIAEALARRRIGKLLCASDPEWRTKILTVMTEHPETIGCLIKAMRKKGAGAQINERAAICFLDAFSSPQVQAKLRDSDMLKHTVKAMVFNPNYTIRAGAVNALLDYFLKSNDLGAIAQLLDRLEPDLKDKSAIEIMKKISALHSETREKLVTQDFLGFIRIADQMLCIIPDQSDVSETVPGVPWIFYVRYSGSSSDLLELMQRQLLKVLQTDDQTTKSITKAMTAFISRTLNSKWFMLETAKNSEFYERMIGKIAKIMDILKQADVNECDLVEGMD